AGWRESLSVPVLASFAHEALAQGRRVDDNAKIPSFFDALGETLAASGRRVALIASADLAHVGPRFGDPKPVSPAELVEIGAADRAMLEVVEAGAAGGFFGSVARGGGRR